MAVSVGHIMAVFIWHLVNVSGLKERLVLKTDQIIFLQCSPSQDVVQGRHGNVPGDTPHSACGNHTWKALSLTYWHCDSDKS